MSHGKPPDSDPISDQLNRAVWLYQVGDLNAAERLCKTILRKKPASPVALHLLAAMAIRHAQLDRALALLDRALRFKADYVEALVERGNVLQLLNRHDEALASYESASRLRPDDVEAIYNRALALVALGRHAEALQSFDRVLTIEPRHVRALNNRGGALHVLNRLDEALSSYDQALALEPRFAEALANRGVVLTALNRHSEALESFDKALLITPNDADALYYRGFVLGELNRCEDAAASYERALKARPSDAKTKFALCMASLPTLYMDVAEIAQRRDLYAARLQSSERRGRPRPRPRLRRRRRAQAAFLSRLPGRQRSRSARPLRRHGVQDHGARYPGAAIAEMPTQGRAVRVGIVSGFFRNHSNWKIPIRGWLSELDRRRFRLFGYYTDARADAQTDEAARLCERFVQGPLSVARWRDEILADAPHVLIYPEVGMDSVAVQLAAQRLAPVQCNSWGHPDTSGFPTLDYFLSSDLMEPADGQDHYTERLVRLPNLSFYYEPPETRHAAIARSTLGLRSSATAFWCGQSLFKYLPQFDEVFPRIARASRRLPVRLRRASCGPEITDLFRQRLERAFAAPTACKAADHCVFLPRLDPNNVRGRDRRCDIILDSIGWSGCNSTFESLHHHLPIVTMAGAFMRGRHTMAILQMMGVTETITRDARRLCGDRRPPGGGCGLAPAGGGPNGRRSRMPSIATAPASRRWKPS